MPWKETDPMTERLQFIAAYLNQVYSRTELCERFGIRRNTGYTWVRRYTTDRIGGAPGAEPCSAPLPPPHVSGGSSSPLGSQASSPALGSAPESCPTARSVVPISTSRHRAPPAHSSSARG